MLENKERIGNFTSGEIYRLQTLNRKKDGLGALGLSYIEEKRIERRLKRSISVEAYSKPMAWGSFMEGYVFKKLGILYKMESKETDVHPTIKGWSGSKDLIVKGVKIAELKCYQPKKFAQYTDALILGDIDNLKKNFAQEYWQMVSNAIINEVPRAEAITFCPFESELEEVRKFAENYEGADQWKYRFIYESDKAGLPYLVDGAYYNNLNAFEFEVPQEDIDSLTINVLKAIKLLESE